MSTSYKIALVAAVVLSALVIGYSVMSGGESVSTTTPTDAGPVATDGTTQPPAGAPPQTQAAPRRPLEPAPRPEPPADASPPPPPADDLLARVMSHADAVQQAQRPSEPPANAPATVEDPIDPPAEQSLAAANQPTDAGVETPDTFTIGSGRPPSLGTLDRPSANGQATAAPVLDNRPQPAPTAPTTFAPPASTDRPAPNSPGAPATTYTIREGDTFVRIAGELYGDQRRWVDIAQANPMVDPQRLRIGQVIRLPSATAMRADESPTPAPASAPAAGSAYVIREGDTLSSIAGRVYGDPNLWYVIFEANRQALDNDPDRIVAGARLTIPPKP